MLGEIVKKLRKSYGLTQVELANSLNVTKQAVSNWENNNIQPSIDMLARIAKFFSVSCDYILEMDQRNFIEVEGLTLEEIAHIQLIINDLKKRKHLKAGHIPTSPQKKLPCFIASAAFISMHYSRFACFINSARVMPSK